MKKVINIIVLMFLVVLFICNSVYGATIPVTDENLNQALQSFVSSDTNEDNYEITMSDGKMTIKVDGKSYTLNYDLTNNPTFTLSIPIKQGMTYNEFKEQTDNLSLPMVGYIGVVNVQGVNIEDAGTYVAKCLLMNAFSSMSSGSSKYIIATDGTTVESTDATVIYESDFGNHVMEYVNSMYSTKQTFSDSTEMGGLNTFTWTTEETDVTSTSCNLVSTLVVNLDADFSKMNGYADSIDPTSNITEQSADYVVKLKVGQKCQIQSSEKITGYGLSGSSCVEFNDDKDVITAIKVGTTKGYLYIGNSDNKKSIYIMVEENTDNSSLETITLKIDNVSDKDISEENTQKDSETKVDNKLNIDTLPRTGEETNVFLIVLYIIVGTSSIALIALLLTKRKRK